MHPRLAGSVDPIFATALDILEQLNQGFELPPVEVRNKLLLGFARGSALMGADRRWELASYALAAWIDEVLVDYPWKGASWWSNNVLEVELFGTRVCSVRFFELAAEAARQADRDALEVFHNCVVLGFRGMYADTQQAANLAANMRIDSTLDGWLRSTEEMVVARIDSHPTVGYENFAATQTERELERMGNSSTLAQTLVRRHRVLQGAPPSHLRSRLVWWSLAVAVLLALNLAAYKL